MQRIGIDRILRFVELNFTPFYTIPISKQGPDRPDELSLIWAYFGMGVV